MFPRLQASLWMIFSRSPIGVAHDPVAKGDKIAASYGVFWIFDDLIGGHRLLNQSDFNFIRT